MATGYDGSIRINTKIDSKGFNQGLNAITGSLKKLAGAVGVAFGVASLVAFGKQAVQIASDLTEVQNVVETAFGTMSSQVDAWAKNSIKQFGMSELAAKRMASTYMAMNAGMGLNGQGAADMAMRTAERAADISSFYNKSIDESDTMLKSIWTGETESLKQIGVVMTQTNLDAYALANGFGKTTQQMTQSEQVMLRYQYVMNQTRLAAGDFVKTQDSWANQTRILSEQWKQFLGIIGQGLIQVLTPALKFLNQMMGVLIQWAQTFTAITGAIFGKQQAQANASAAAVGNVADASNAAADGQNALAGATKKAGKEAKGALASFDQLNVLERGAADAGAVGTGIAAGAGAAVSVPAMTGEIGADVKVSPIVESTVNKLRSLFEPLQKINLDNLKSSLDRLKEAMKPITSKLFEALEWAYKEIFVPFANWVISSAVPTFLDVLSGALAVLNSVLDALKPLGIWLWDNFLQPIAAWTGGVIVTVLKWLAEKLTAIGDWISSNQTMVQDFAIILGGVAGAILAVKGAIIAVKTAFKVASAVSSIFANGLNLQLLPMTAIVVAIGAIIGIIIVCIRHWDEIKAVALDCWNKIKEAWNKAGDWFHKNVTEPIGNFFTGLWDGIKGAFTKAFDFIKKAFKGYVNGWITMVESFINFFVNGINFLIKGINKLSFDIPEWFPVGGGSKFGFDIPVIPKVQIPRLAQGAVIPPNQQFAAILGDQKHGRNLEAPEGLIRQIVREETGNVYNDVLRAINNSNLGKKATIMGDVIMDGQKVGRLVAKPVFREGNRAGYIKVKV
ncbi:MAG: hypothetical protein ACLVB9_05655 [Acutalibacteraceae bacterium]|uniref:hypothetical protein n=1 Tax=Candidatus Fimivicinus sp. TaxID=3056640 RepID=UPI003A234475